MQVFTRLFFNFLFGLFVAGLVLPASALQKPTFSVDVSFEKTGVSLNAMEREKIVSALNKVRLKDWCGFELATVTAYQDPREGHSGITGKLAKNRADYLENLLREYGVPKSSIVLQMPVGEVYGGNESAPPGTVQIDMIGGIWPKPCPYPISSGGFRVQARP